AGPAADPRLEVLGAMETELGRTMERLRLPGYEPPYFVGYTVRDLAVTQIAARFGALQDDTARHDRLLLADVRVGSYELDSSGGNDPLMLFGSDGPAWTAPKDAPLDADGPALRNALWLVTDEKYKEALSNFLKKRSRDVYRDEADARAPSFTREPPQRHVDPARPLAFDRDRWRRIARQTSALFRAHPHVFDSSVRVTAERQIRWIATSEGARIVTEATIVGLHLQATARAPDGQLLEDGRDFYGPSEADLPSEAKLRTAVTELAAELKALQAAPVIDPYTGPAILEPEAAGVLFHEAVGHRLEGERLDDDKEGQTFKGQVGRAVLPTFLSVSDDPTLAAAVGSKLNGHYAFDDQGVPAKRVALIRDGLLESYLLSRKPVTPFTRSNGHGRAQGGRAPAARMATLLVESRKSVTREELKRQLVAEVRRQGRPYGLVIRDISGGNTNTASYGYQAFKGTPRLVYRVDAATGKEELVRGVELVGTPLASVSRILVTDDAPRVFNGFCGAESGYVPVSTIAPALLVQELELQRVARQNERGTILPSPWSAGVEVTK
ncbi:MAG: TldD/PmbA family protein, partial [Anaeromyxobacteraceae bacterium]